MKLVGADIGRFEKEMFVRSVAIAPAQRYVVEVMFEEAGEYLISNRITGLNHELIDDAVKNYSVIETVLRQFGNAPGGDWRSLIE